MPDTTTTKDPVPEYTYDAYHTNKSRYAKRKEAMTKYIFSSFRLP